MGVDAIFLDKAKVFAFVSGKKKLAERIHDVYSSGVYTQLNICQQSRPI